MVHELFGIQNGRVDLGQVPDIRPELKVRLLSMLECTPVKIMAFAFHIGNHIDNLHRPLLPSSSSRHFR